MISQFKQKLSKRKRERENKKNNLILMECRMKVFAIFNHQQVRNPNIALTLYQP